MAKALNPEKKMWRGNEGNWTNREKKTGK